MKEFCFRCVLILMIGALAAASARGQFTFNLVDNFESGKVGKWYAFGQISMLAEKITTREGEVRDTIAESCGDYLLKLKGKSSDWYAGGAGTDLFYDATAFSRLQMDIYGGDSRGKIKVEIFDDDNRNFTLEQDPSHDWVATKDDKWVAEVPVMGRGFTRISVPFSAFYLENPGYGDGVWNPGHNDGSGGLLKMQLILLTDKKQGQVEVGIDNILLTY